MNTSDTHQTTNSALVATIPDDWEKIPCVQYGFPADTGPIRAPTLRTVLEPVPDGAVTASPVYVLTRAQYDRQQRLETGFEVKEATSIAKELQDECEAADRVLYPIHIESDAYHKKEPDTLIEWFSSFVKDSLGVPFHSCTLYFSGNRSIHVHVPRFVSGETQRERLKELAETFCSETGAELDCGLYSRKRMFRLPGAEHADTGLRKVGIKPEWDHDRIFQASMQTSRTLPASYAAVLEQVFVTQASLTVGSAKRLREEPTALFKELDSDRTVLQLDGNVQTDSDPPLIEQETYPANPGDAIPWLQYNAKEFSPYALAGGNNRSVAAVRVKGGAFCRDGRRDGATMVPAYFYGARGCNGEFTKADEHAPLQLSTPDYRKWDSDAGDHVVIIGGQSKQSRIFLVEPWQARVVGHALTGDHGSRKAALEYLQNEGYETGSAEAGGASNSSSMDPVSDLPSSKTDASTIWPARDTPRTEAERLQRQAEQQGIQTLSHDGRIRVACRVLQYGWEPAWEWFKKQFGPEFDPAITHRQFRSIVEGFEDCDHIEVPPAP